MLESNNNNHRVILDLCGGTGSWSAPYKSNNYDVRVIDPQEWLENNNGTGDVRLMEYMDEEIYGILCAPPCTHFSGGGARWWEEKGEGVLLDGLSVVDACLRIITMHKPKFWCLENPVGRLRKYLGDPSLIFQPHEFGDPWIKKTMLWGNFNIPKYNNVKPEFSLVSKYKDPRKRSMTPPSFAQAFFESNK